MINFKRFCQIHKWSERFMHIISKEDKIKKNRVLNPCRNFNGKLHWFVWGKPKRRQTLQSSDNCFFMYSSSGTRGLLIGCLTSRADQ